MNFPIIRKTQVSKSVTICSELEQIDEEEPQTLEKEDENLSLLEIEKRKDSQLLEIEKLQEELEEKSTRLSIAEVEVKSLEECLARWGVLGFL